MSTTLNRPAPLAAVNPQRIATEAANLRKRRGISTELLSVLDDVYRASGSLAMLSPCDGAPFVQQMLGTVLRLAWLQMTGRLDTYPDPKSVPMKLYQRGVLSKRGLHELRTAVDSSPSPSHAPQKLDCIAAMLKWLADDTPGCAVRFNGEGVQV